MNKVLIIRPEKLKKWRLELLQPIFDLGIIGNGVILGGGAIRSLFKSEEEISDVDLFFNNLDLVAPLREKLVALGAELKFECPENKLFSYKFPDKPIDTDVFEKGLKIQLICERTYLDAASLIFSFDLNACCGAWDGEKFYIHSNMVKDIKTKTLSLMNLTFPIATLKRICKYNKKGYRVHKIAEQYVNEMIQFMSNGGAYSEENLRVYID